MATRKRGKGRSSGRLSRRSEPTVERTLRRRHRPIVLVAVAVLVLALAGYRFIQFHVASILPPAIDVGSGAAAGFNVALVTIDTLRADRVRCYGYTGVRTPAMDSLAAGGVRFADAVTVVPMTLPSHATIMTGDYPPTHGVRDNGMYRLAAQRETLAERLKSKGYVTAAFLSAFVLDKRYGLDQGFDVYNDEITPEHSLSGGELLNPQRPGNTVTDAAIQWLEEYREAQSGSPFFTWLHLFDPHAPYAPPEPFKTRYASNPYDGEVAFADQQVGRFVDKLRRLGLLDKTIVVVVGDHGEGLGDHGEHAHSLLVYETTMGVPLIFYCPGLIPGGRVVDDRVVATVDVAPTLLDLLGFDTGGSDGVSLLREDADSDRAIYLETLAPKLNHGWSPLYAMRRHIDKYIEAPTPEYYDLSSDPGELRNLWADNRDATEALAGRLALLMESFAGLEESGESTVQLDREAIEKLAALGYVSGRTVEESDSPLDPKEMIANWDRKLMRASALVGARRPDEAIPLIEELLDVAPNDVSLWSLLSTAQTDTSQLEAAIASRTRAIELLPTDASSWVALAQLQHVNGDLEASSANLAEAERLEPELGSIFIARALLAWYAGEYEEALAYCVEARTRDPARFTAQSRSLEDRIRETMRRGPGAGAVNEPAQGTTHLDE